MVFSKHGSLKQRTSLQQIVIFSCAHPRINFFSQSGGRERGDDPERELRASEGGREQMVRWEDPFRLLLTAGLLSVCVYSVH